MLACLLRLAFSLFILLRTPTQGMLLPIRGLPVSVNNQDNSPKDRSMGQRDLANSPLRVSSQVTLGWIKLSAKTNWHTKRLESSTNK